MHRPAQRDQRDQREQRPARRGPRLNRLLVCAAAVPVVLVTAGCSSDSGSGGDAKPQESSTSPGESASANTVRPAAYAKLPAACAVLPGKTLEELVPKGAKSGKEGRSEDTATRASCSWSSLQNNGIKGSQFRWLNVSLLRFESDATRGEGDKLARAYYAKQVREARSVPDAQNTRSEPVAGTGDEATAVRYDLKKKEGAFKQQTVVARVENVVITLDYNGAGLAGDKTPNADDLTKAAEKAVKDAVAAVSAANGEGGGAGTPPAASPSKGASATKSPSPSASESAAKSASPTASSGTGKS
ncbi:DUF3558 domain-containing protein [Streptomyces caeni]|uniref:DUF3558 domain-containing protein n=1 Tax=Streptomyces caeni TaxID=2307231 RepID=A0ABW4IKJ3_9ACTN